MDDIMDAEVVDGVALPAPALQPDQARLNITWAGNNGDLPEPVSYDATDEDIKTWAAEAVRGGHIPGIPAAEDVAFHDFIVDRFPATPDVGFNRLFLRPKTPFGGSEVQDSLKRNAGDKDLDEAAKVIVANVHKRLPWGQEAYLHGQDEDGTVLVGIRPCKPKPKLVMEIKFSPNMIKQIKWMLERSEGKNGYCGAADLNGDIWETSTKDGQMVLRFWGETRDTRQGTIEYWNGTSESDAPLGADGKPISV
jgi:hypothetical protein